MDLSSESTGQVCRSWNTCVKLAWDVPRWTHNYLVDNLLGGDLPPVKKKLMCQFVNFFQKLRKSPLREVRILASLAGRDRLSVTGKNLAMLEEEFGLDPWTQIGNMFKCNYKGYSIPDGDKRRLPLLQISQSRYSLYSFLSILSFHGFHIGSLTP